ncbi:hypothetical protein [Bacillus sp. Marseille-P3661]|uniref:hypothetical protein n=1 Tax=Bacillus sp. Marseille-P3661 TaxID=1936234 RepID=UPI000C83D340|nr:hypothetical protein [Bacillus sp. Marseille-P3661]
MAKTKIRISPSKEDKVELTLDIEGLSKENLVEVADAYFFEDKKVSKSGNELYYTIFFNKRFFNKKVIKNGNPSITMYSSNKLLTINIKAEFSVTDIRQNESNYIFEKEVAGDVSFTVKFTVSENYYREKITEKRENQEM